MDQAIPALVAFTFTAGMTPGPNNIMLMASGVNFGFRRTIPHMAGVALGFPLMVALIGVGFGATIIALPWVHDAVSLVGIPYLLWLAWHIASADTAPEIATLEADQSESKREPRPMSFLGASAFQWVNAKAWVMAIGMLAIYAPHNDGVAGGIAIVVGVNILIAILSSVTWTACGSILATWLENPVRLRVFNCVMAALLVATLMPASIDLVVKYL